MLNEFACGVKHRIRFTAALYDKRATTGRASEVPMQASTLVSLRANAVLIALCVAASDAAWLAICGCAGNPNAIQAPLTRMATLLSAAFIVIAVRRIAKLSFDAARASRRIAWAQDAAHRLVIARPSSDDWLVQLHVELHPSASRRSVAHACSHAAAACRVPRDRA
jgi:hypothetical protein